MSSIFILAGSVSTRSTRLPFQGPVLAPLALALRPLLLPAEVKALFVASAGGTGSFALAWLLVGRTRLGRIL